MNRFERDKMIGLGEEYNKGRKYVMEHLDDFDESYWYGIINALRSQGIREAKKTKKNSLVKQFLESKK